MKIAVIGGGIVGATAAFYLSQERDVALTLYDQPTGQATSAAAGIISPWLSQRRNKNWYHLAKTGAAFYPTLIQDLGLPVASTVYKKTGTLLFKKDRPLLEKLEQLALTRREEAPEIGDISILTPEEITAKLPLIQTNQEALFITGGARIDGGALVQTLKDRTQKNGRTVINSKVDTLTHNGTSWQVTSTGQTACYDCVILGMGAWLPDLLTPLGYQVDVRGQKGQLVELTTAHHTTDWPVVMPQGESDIIPFDDGKILVGATHENDAGYDLTIDQEKITALIASVSHLTPDLATADQLAHRVGTRAYTSDYLPFFGTIQESPNLFVASGLGSSGLTTGPIIGKTLAEMALTQETSLPIENYLTDNYITKKTLTQKGD